MEKDKQFYMAKELGKAQGRIELLESSVKHYRKLVDERTRALHGAEREIRRLKKELRAATSAGPAL